MKVYQFLLIIIVLIACSTTNELVVKNENEPHVVMLSFDGFRHDYVEKYDAKNFLKFINGGISTEGLIPSFPSKTFPNHYSIVTGLYPGNHGLVENRFYDRELDLYYTLKDRTAVENPLFYGGLPVWQLAQKNGMKSASFFWVGSETEIQGSYPDYWKRYSPSTSNEQRIKQIIDWLNLPQDDRPRIITAYFSLIDHEGHNHGPNSEKVKEAVQTVDHLLGELMNGLEQIDLDVNVILVSDHGMEEILSDESHLLSESVIASIIKKYNATYFNSNTHFQIYCQEETSIMDLYDELSNVKGHFKVYLKKDMPDHWHYKHNKRVGDMFLAFEPGYTSYPHLQKVKKINDKHPTGTHGYDPTLSTNMNGIFYANGPQIANHQSFPAMENIHIYPFVASLLGIHEIPHIDGDKAVLAPYLSID